MFFLHAKKNFNVEFCIVFKNKALNMFETQSGHTIYYLSGQMFQKLSYTAYLYHMRSND